MSLTIELTSDWPYERIAAYGKELTAAFGKLVEAYPKDLSVKSIAQDILSGKQQLWLIREGEEFRSFGLTEIKTNEATGHKTVLVTGLAGEGGADLPPLIAPVEEWARTIGADEVSIIGRWGWKRGFEAQGFRMDAVLMRKSV